MRLVIALAVGCWLALCTPRVQAQPAPPPPSSETAAAHAPLDLRPKYQAGRVSRFWVWTQRDQTTQVQSAGQSRNVAVRMVFEGELTWSVDRVHPDGSASCTMTVDWMSATLTDPQGATQSNDSRRASGDNDAVQRLLKAMAGVPIRLEMAADGRATSASGVEAIRQKAGEGVNVPDELDFLESASDLATLPAAPEPTKPANASGDPATPAIQAAWDAAFIWNHELGKMRYATRYNLLSREEIAGIPVATVRGESGLSLEVDPAKLAVPAGGPRVDVRLVNGKHATQVMYDLQRGEAVGRDSTQTTRIEARMQMNGQTAIRITDETLRSQALRIEERS